MGLENRTTKNNANRNKFDIIALERLTKFDRKSNESLIPVAGYFPQTPFNNGLDLSPEGICRRKFPNPEPQSTRFRAVRDELGGEASGAFFVFGKTTVRKRSTNSN